MCSFLIYYGMCTSSNVKQALFKLKFRGPDLTHTTVVNGYTFNHCLLHITGKVIPQPFVQGSVVALFNGEIYNYSSLGSFKTDGQCLIPTYLKHGKHFVRQLDGDFALCVYDFKNQRAILSSDLFATKPIWYGIVNGRLAVASYESSLRALGCPKPQKVPPNQTFVWSLQEHKVIERIEIYHWDLRQTKNTLDDWVKAFEEAVKKRTRSLKYPLFICLSSGYDSGSLAAALNHLQVKYNSYSIMGVEDPNILHQRERLNRKNAGNLIIKLDRTQVKDEHKFLLEKAEWSSHKLFRKFRPKIYRPIQDDMACAGLAVIFRKAKSQNQRIYLSGQGPDEIFADYGFRGVALRSISTIGGLFPENLKDVFPWHNFQKGSMEGFIAKEEHVAGSLGIEARYPFLDRQVVQEFLWLTAEIKNQVYKAPLDYYLKLRGYPFEVNAKYGFKLGTTDKLIRKEKAKNARTFKEILDQKIPRPLQYEK